MTQKKDEDFCKVEKLVQPDKPNTCQEIRAKLQEVMRIGAAASGPNRNM